MPFLKQGSFNGSFHFGRLVHPRLLGAGHLCRNTPNRLRVYCAPKTAPAWRAKRLKEREQKSGQRQSANELACDHFKHCSGCTLETDLCNPPQLLEARRYFANRGVTPLHATFGPLHEWRFRARLAVRGSSARPVIGLYATGTHNVTDIPSCRCVVCMTRLIPVGVQVKASPPHRSLSERPKACTSAPTEGRPCAHKPLLAQSASP